MQIGDVQVYAVDDDSTKSLTYGSQYLTYFADFGGMIDMSPIYAGYSDFSITPALPEGLSFNTMNGQILGALTLSMVNETVYTVNATNVMTQGREQVSFTMSIRSRLAVWRCECSVRPEHEGDGRAAQVQRAGQQQGLRVC